MLDIEQISKTKAVSLIDKDIEIIDIYGNAISPFKIIDLFEDDIFIQRGVTSSDEIVHITDAISVGSGGGGGGRCSWVYHVLHQSKGVFDYTRDLTKLIANEKKERVEKRRAYKRWSNQAESLLRQMYMWDFELLDEAILYGDEFISEHFGIQRKSL